MPTVGDTFLYNGAPTNGATVKLWPLASFAAEPAQDDALPVGSPAYGPALTAATSGGAGAWTLGGVRAGEYWASYEYAGRIGWAHLFVPGSAPAANLLVNGGMEVKQHPATTFTASGVVTLDQWTLSLAGAAACTVSQISSTIGAVGNSIQLAYTHAVGGSVEVLQRCENFTQLRGRILTFAVTIKSTVAGTVFVYLYDGTTTTTSAFNVGVGVERLVVTATMASGASVCQAGIKANVATCTIEANDATLVVSNAPMDYIPLPSADEIVRCLRYREVHGGLAATGGTVYGIATAAGQTLGMTRFFGVPKGGTPTVTRFGTLNLINIAGQPNVVNVSPQSYGLTGVSSAAGVMAFEFNSADDYILIDWSP